MELDMGKFDSWVAGLRDTIINASELAKSVASSQMQVGEMTTTLESLRSLNRTLDENLSWSRSERDRLENALRQSQTELEVANNLVTAVQRDNASLKAVSDERASIIATLKVDNDTIAFKNLELEEDNARLKGIVDNINAILQPKKVVEEHSERASTSPAAQGEKTPEPFLHPVTGVLQGRDPETKQFVPIKDEAKEDKPWWMDQPKKATGSDDEIPF